MGVNRISMKQTSMRGVPSNLTDRRSRPRYYSLGLTVKQRATARRPMPACPTASRSEP